MTPEMLTSIFDWPSRLYRLITDSFSTAEEGDNEVVWWVYNNTSAFTDLGITSDFDTKHNRVYLYHAFEVELDDSKGIIVFKDDYSSDQYEPQTLTSPHLVFWARPVSATRYVPLWAKE